MPLDVDLPDHLTDLIVEGISTNSTADLEIQQGLPINYIGNKTECALLKFVQELGVEYKQVRDEAVTRGVLCFSSERKRMSTLIERSGEVHNCRLHVKVSYKNQIKADIHHVQGQPELLLKLCDTIVDKEGKVKDLTEEKKESLQQYIEYLAKKGKSRDYCALC